LHWIVLVGAYIILWFLALQILLPIGVKAPHESGDAVLGGADPGAPVRSHLGLKAGIATLAATVIWAGFYALVLLHIIDL
jgi:predicted secreted protein